MKKRDKVVLHSIATNLKRLREKKGLSKSELARMIDDWPATIQRIEDEDSMPGVGLLYSLAHALEVEFQDFLSEADATLFAKAS